MRKLMFGLILGLFLIIGIGFVSANILDDLEKVIDDHPATLLSPQNLIENLDFNGDSKVDATDKLRIRNIYSFSDEEFQIIYNKLVAEVNIRIGAKSGEDNYIEGFDVDRDGLIEDEEDLGEIKKVLIGDRFGCEGADINSDNVVNAFDLLKVRQCFNQTLSGDCLVADIDGNGIVEEFDADIVRAFYLQSCEEKLTCKDSDGGKNSYNFGKAELSDGTQVNEDYCASNGISLMEAYCNFLEKPSYSTYACPNGCKDGVCICTANSCDDGTIPKCEVSGVGCVCETCSGLKGDENTCLDNPSNYWDQETDKCYSGYSKDKIIGLCSDPDNGENVYEYAHTFGFRSSSSAEDSSRDLRIRTGGSDACLSDGRMVEHYCDVEGYIRTSYVDCPNGCLDGACIKGEPVTEKITCKFENIGEVGKEQQCYLAGQWGPEDLGTKYCIAEPGVGSCVLTYNSYNGEKVTWKSTCGGYQYTTQDGNDEKVGFDCGSGETNVTQISGKGFRKVYFQCYDGEESKSSDREACKSAEFWKKFSENFCESHCNKKSGKCGVNSFSIGEECYIEEGELGKELIGVEEGGVEEVGLMCKDSCPLDGKCYPFGYRKSGEYCSDEGDFIKQKKGESCENNFECSSNVCVNSECISEGFLKKVMNWFRRLFGGE